jgi:transposase
LAEVKRLFEFWHQWHEGQLDWASFQLAMAPIQQRVSEWLRAGMGCDQPRTARTCRNILKLEASLWTFVRVEGVEPTNNNAERPLRRAVIWRRKSFGTQSAAGSSFVERILTAVTTLRQQGRDVLDYLTAACASITQGKESICLVPDSS